VIEPETSQVVATAARKGDQGEGDEQALAGRGVGAEGVGALDDSAREDVPWPLVTLGWGVADGSQERREVGEVARAEGGRDTAAQHLDERGGVVLAHDAGVAPGGIADAVVVVVELGQPA
jgi:hypothetical protein